MEAEPLKSIINLFMCADRLILNLSSLLMLYTRVKFRLASKLENAYRY
jgi:hypothetical protein